jgi:serine phosphatase RsbU (regulator of sigma subunit)
MSNEIERRIEGLSQLHTTAQKISTKLETPSLLRTSIESLRGLLGTKNALGFYRGPSSKGPVLDQDNWQAEDRPKLRSLLGKLQKIPMGESPSVVEHEGTPYLVAPIREQANPSGFVLFSGNEKGSFDNEDIHMTGAVMSSVGTSFENIRLLRETADKARIEKELETAKHVQNTMFPPESLTFGPTQIESFYEPAAECGGDWWGALSLPGSRLVIAIGDATGHGVPSALLTASARATFSVLEAIVRRDSPKAASPALILQLLNRAVRDSAKGKILMTMFVATLNTETGEVIVANASHDPVYRLNGEGELNVVECTPGLRLGEETDLLVDETTLQMEAGETLVLYTDGLPEGLNGIDEEYSDRKFQRSIKKHRGLDLASMRDKVIEDFRNFTGDRKFADDVTLVLARFIPKNSAT